MVHKLAVWRPTVSMTISGVPLFPRRQLGRAVTVLRELRSCHGKYLSNYHYVYANTTEDREKEAEDTCLDRNMTSLSHIWMDPMPLLYF
ncbi:MAG: hypothetical protein ACJ70T_07955 [Nitrososphaera sp.]